MAWFHVTGVLVLVLGAPSHGGVLDDISARQALLTRHMMSVDLSLGDEPTGTKSVRSQRMGTRVYNSEWHNSFKVLTIHNHADHFHVVGLGEFAVALNRQGGTEFRTRHNDYSLVQPVANDKTYHVVRRVDFPETPPQVAKQSSVKAQIEEMRKCFKAWKDQSTKLCNYKKYFKPILCYLEGGWTRTGDKIEESFFSDRHFMDAVTWTELHKKTRYSAHAGYKDVKENFAFLPTRIFSSLKDGETPKLYQWNYRIMCHHLKDDLPTSKLRYVEHLMDRMDMSFTLEKQLASNGAQFTLDYDPSEPGSGPGKLTTHTLLDELMEQIPGKDNYGAFIPDNDCGVGSLNFTTGKPLNAAYYHRWYKVGEKFSGPSRQTEIHKGFNDPHVFMAQTTNSKIAGVRLRCGCDSRGKCITDAIKRFTYAIPLEIIFLTPLSKWNPYDIEYKGESYTKLAKTVTAKGRKGSKTDKNKAYDGVHSKLYYITPSSFFGGKEINKDAADTVVDSVGVLNRKKRLVTTAAAGVRIFLPEIPGVGILRQRYPIAPFNSYAYGTYKELTAFRDAILDKPTFPFILPKVTAVNGDVKNKAKPPPPPKKSNPIVKPVDTSKVKVPVLWLNLVKNAKNNYKHTHSVKLTKTQVATLMANARNTVQVKTGPGDGHTHMLTIRLRLSDGKYLYTSCDKRTTCFGKHSKFLIDCGLQKTRPECLK